MKALAAPDFPNTMKRLAYEELRFAHQGVERVVLTDFPDYDNVGDSAIGLGEMEFYRATGIEVRSVHCIGTAPRSYDEECAVALQGGGNFGGLYPDHDEYRYQLAESLPGSTLLIQEPQTVFFVSDSAREEFRRRMASRQNLRIVVRDQESYDLLKDDVEGLFLTPDAAHMLGPIVAPSPTRRAVFLLRRDTESRLRSDRSVVSKDWPDLRGMRWLSVHLHSGMAKRFSNRLSETLNPSGNAWKSVAERRLGWGVSLLAEGETVVTDRLHAMILALQMGRRVVAIDNSNRKLTRYADTWFERSDVDLTFVEDVSQASARV